MDDLEATRLCAEAMGFGYTVTTDVQVWVEGSGDYPKLYDPLHDDAQAMALVKKMQLFIMPEHEGLAWNVSDKDDHRDLQVSGDDLNSAIVYCVAAMQQAKAK